MALRSEARIAAGLMMAALWAQGAVEVQVRHDHLWKSGSGVLAFTDEGVEYRETAGEPDHSRKWNYDDVQRLTVNSAEVRILTYADDRWRGGRDREWTFERMAEGEAERITAFVRDLLPGRLVAAVADSAAAEWEIPVKWKRGFGGPEGMLAFAGDAVVFQSPERDASRTWRMEDIESVSSSGRWDLTITTSDRTGVWRGGPTEHHFQLKRPLPEERYQALWRRVQRGKGLAILEAR